MINDRLIVTAKVQNTPFDSRITEERIYSFDISSDSKVDDMLENLVGLMLQVGYHAESIKQAMAERGEIVFNEGD